MDAITALRAMPSARNIDYDVNDYSRVAEWGGSPSTLRYGARRGAAECDWPGLWGLLEAYVVEYMVSDILRSAYLHRMGNYCVCRM